MRELKIGDRVFFYHSNCKPPGIAGLMTVTREAYPDFTAWDAESKYYDPKSSAGNPRWFMVDVTFERDLKRYLSLGELKRYPQLENLPLLRKGNRLSILPVAKADFDFILKLERMSPPAG